MRLYVQLNSEGEGRPYFIAALASDIVLLLHAASVASAAASAAEQAAAKLSVPKIYVPPPSTSFHGHEIAGRDFEDFLLLTFMQKMPKKKHLFILIY